ncbi:MAG: DUF5671 domain-containing protein [Patescibacteria group bacterium]
MDTQGLNKYIETARSQGQTDIQIKQQLLTAGWPANVVDLSLNPVVNQVPQPNIVPPPPTPTKPPSSNSTPDDHFGMWVVFEYVLMFVTLAINAMALAGIGHFIVNSMLKNAGGYSYFGGSLLTWYIAAIIVSFPIFAYLFVDLKKRILRNPDMRNMKTRKQLVYVALVWTFIVLITRAVLFVYNFLNSTDSLVVSVANLVVTFLTSGLIFFYFLSDVRKDSR